MTRAEFDEKVARMREFLGGNVSVDPYKNADLGEYLYATMSVNPNPDDALGVLASAGALAVATGGYLTMSVLVSDPNYIHIQVAVTYFPQPGESL